MILLKAHSRTPERRIPTEALQLTLKERDSSATLTPADMTGIGPGSWILIDKGPGAGTAWFVKQTRWAEQTGTVMLQLAPAIRLLEDIILPSEVTPSTMGGGETCTARQAVQYLLGRQSDWVLGSFGFSDVRNAYKFDGETIFEGLERVTETLPDAMWVCDMSQYPFRLSIVPRDSGEQSILRPRRNMITMSRTVDRSQMFTRFYPVGKNDIELPEGYMERNVDLYGVIEHTETDQTRASESELRSWGDDMLRRHADPTVTTDVDGLDLADATGEDVDRLAIGRRCLIPMEGGGAILETITQLSYPDAVHEPERVRITLANTRTDVTRILAETIRRSGRGGRAAAKKAKEDNAWFEDTNDHVAMCAKGIVGVDADGKPNWTQMSEVVVDGKGIHQRVQSVQGELVVAQAQIDVNAERILQEVLARGAMGEALSGRITVEANRITQEVARASKEEDKLSGRITTEAGKITQIVEAVGKDGKVTAASIVTAVNNSSSSILLNADKIALSGRTTINDVMRVSDGRLSFTGNSRFDGDVMAGSLTLRQGSSATTLRDISGVIVNAQSSGNVLTLTRADGDTLTFSKATTLRGAWSGGVYTVTATPQGNEISTALAAQLINGNWSADKKTYTGNVAYAAGENYVSTGRQITVNAGEAWSAGEASVTAEDPYAASSTTGTKTDNTIYSKTSTGKTEGRKIYLDYDSSEHVVWVRWDSMSGTRILGRSV